MMLSPVLTLAFTLTLGWSVLGDDADMFDFSRLDEPTEQEPENTESVENTGRVKCRSNRHVCSTLLKYPGDQTFSDGVHCACPGCSENWREDDNQSLTWVHYERRDRQVQYRFCIPVIPEKTCSPKELAIIMETETTNWRVYMATARCKCPNNVYQLSNWWKRNRVWMYEYHCEKKNCETQNSLCAKIYVDDVHKSILGYEFECACPKGYMCPSDRKPDTPLSVDFRGYHAPMYCEPLHTNKKRS